MTAISPFFHVFRSFLNCVGPLYMAIKFFAFFFPTISTFGCFWSQWPTSLAVTSGREGVRTTSFKPWRPHRGSCRGATMADIINSVGPFTRYTMRCGRLPSRSDVNIPHGCGHGCGVASILWKVPETHREWNKIQQQNRLPFDITTVLHIYLHPQNCQKELRRFTVCHESS